MTRQGLRQVKAAAGKTIAGAALLLLPACSASPNDGVVVEDAYVKMAPIPDRPASAYFRLRTAREAARLLAVTSPSASRIELHGSMNMEGMASMAALGPEDLSFRDGALDFVPGGKHAMIFGLAPEARRGGRVPLTLSFAGAPSVTVQAEVRAIGDAR